LARQFRRKYPDASDFVRAIVPPASDVISTLATGNCFLGSVLAVRTAPTSDRSRLIRGNCRINITVTTPTPMIRAAQIAAARRLDVRGST
jgi:hypothetical protein